MDQDKLQREGICPEASQGVPSGAGDRAPSQPITYDIDIDKLIIPYCGVQWYADAHGYIAWRVGTGRNCEILHLRAYRPGNGGGTHLLRTLLKRLKESPPYCSVYGFTRISPYGAREFYEGVGFSTTIVPWVYLDGQAVLFSAPYSGLVRIHLPEEQDAHDQRSKE